MGWESSFTSELYSSPPSAYLMHKYYVPFKPSFRPKSRNSPVLLVGKNAWVDGGPPPHSSYIAALGLVCTVG